jgi:hypothetical protein
MLTEVNGQFIGNLNYNNQILDRATAEAMAADYFFILDAILRDPDTRIEDLRLKDQGADSEREEISI